MPLTGVGAAAALDITHIAYDSPGPRTSSVAGKDEVVTLPTSLGPDHVMCITINQAMYPAVP